MSAAEQAVDAEAIQTALWYLADAARFGPVRPAAELAELAVDRPWGARRSEGGQSPATRAASVHRRAEARLGPRGATSTLTIGRWRSPGLRPLGCPTG